MTRFRKSIVIGFTIPNETVADLDRLIERERKAARRDDPYPKGGEVSRSHVIRRALVALLVEAGIVKGVAA